jgi:hypothetical protein
MPNDKDTHPGSTPGPAPNSEGGLLRNLILLTLPLLSFQRDILPTIRTSLETHKDEHIKAIGNLLSLELHALMMTLDPARKLRGRSDDNLERLLKTELTQLLEKMAGGLITVVELQEKILPPLIDTLKKAKSREPANTPEEDK